MDKLKGTLINKIPNFLKLMDLEYYDGPLLSLFEDENDNLYLFDWIDCEWTNNKISSNRWLVVNLSLNSLLKMFNEGIYSDEIRKKAKIIYYVDIKGNDDIYDELFEIKYEDLPFVDLSTRIYKYYHDEYLNKSIEIINNLIIKNRLKKLNNIL